MAVGTKFEPDPVKLFVAVLYGSDASSSLDLAIESMNAEWGPIDISGADHPWADSNYYAEEMGDGLTRRLISFESLVSPEALSSAKRRTIEIEDELRIDGRRPVNLDVGYLDPHKYVVASAKAAGQKVYLGDGIWADIQARFRQGLYRPFEWSFPDFASGVYDDELLSMREKLRAQLRERASRDKMDA